MVLGRRPVDDGSMMVVFFFFFCEDVLFWSLTFEGSKSVGRSNPSSSRCFFVRRRIASIETNRRCRHPRLSIPRPFVQFALASASVDRRTSRRRRLLCARRSFFSLDSNQRCMILVMVFPPMRTFKRSPHRVLSVVLCSSVGSSSSSYLQSCLQRRSLSLCVCRYVLSLKAARCSLESVYIKCRENEDGLLEKIHVANAIRRATPTTTSFRERRIRSSRRQSHVKRKHHSQQQKKMSNMHPFNVLLRLPQYRRKNDEDAKKVHRSVRVPTIERSSRASSPAFSSRCFCTDIDDLEDAHERKKDDDKEKRRGKGPTEDEHSTRPLFSQSSRSTVTT